MDHLFAGNLDSWYKNETPAGLENLRVLQHYSTPGERDGFV